MPSLNLSVSFASLSSTQTKTKTTVVAAVAATAGTVWFVRNRMARRRRIQRQKDCKQKLQLLPNENSFLLKTTPPMNTLTVFECGSLEEVETAKVHFRERTRQIVQANPWLQGYLDVDTQDKQGNLALFVPNHTSNTNNSFVVLDNLGPLSEDYHTMVQTLDKAMIGNTVEHVASHQETKDGGMVWEPLWRVAFIPSTKDEEGDDKKKKTYTFGLVVSGNHCLMDGHGYYKLFNMLSSKEVVQFLNPVRNHDLGDSIRKATGTEPSFMTEPPLGFILGFLASTIRNLVFPQTKSIGFEVSNDWIQSQKKEHYQWSIPHGDADSDATTPPAFVSTNDLIVSEFCKHTKCHLALMAMNLRGRAAGCTDHLLGNYEHLVAYTPEDYASPASIRKSVTGPVYQRVGANTTTSPLPTSGQHLWGCTYAVMTNWATFAHELQVQGRKPSPETVALTTTSIRQKLHLPLFDFPASTPACKYSSMVIFRPREGAIGILAGGTAAFLDQLKASPMVGSVLYDPA